MSTENVYSRLGLKKIINAAGTYTVIGGSRMSDQTLSDIASASHSFTEIVKLQKTVHERIAEITNNEASFISTGGAASIYLTIAASVAKKYNKPFKYLTTEEISTSEVIVFRSQRNPYDWALRQVGVKLIEVGYPNIIGPATEEDLKAVITEHVSAVFYTAGGTDGWVAEGSLDLQITLDIATKAGIPVIVDAAAQLPPLDNLWNFTKMGASAVIFSGGKDLKGPQASGLIVGKKDFFDIITSTGFPNYGIGRMLKVGREEIVALWSAIEQYVAMDHSLRLEWCENQIKMLMESLSGSLNIRVSRSFPNEAGQPIPRAIVEFSKMDSKEVINFLMEGDPGIYTMSGNEKSIYINPMTLEEGEMEIIINRLIKLDK